ncbi:uncharacterized protein LOC114554581 [Perca flavescens]|uniref:uncharacterized protein LOC114554581 n=1 Tax=Perca flavescens TaxID=8167 RepID=UPI00106EA89C|nr:uncharacterized protein LOC114554581 [Perca flavescens]
MSQQKENINAKQSPLDPDKMENEAEHFKNRETDSTSRPSSRESEKTVSSVIDEIASIIVSDTLDRTSCNINELMQSISWWEAEERSKSETDNDEDKSSADCRINQKVKRHLKRFFGLRRIFAEHKGETLKDTKEDLVIEMDSTQAPSGQDGHHVPINVSTQKFCNSDRTVEKSACTHGRKVIKRMKSALKRHFKLKKKAAEQNLDGSPYPEDLRSDHLEGEHEDVIVEETINISSTLSLTGSSQPEEHYEVRSEVMEETLVTHTVLTPGRSEAEQKDEIAGSASINLTSKDTYLREVPIYMEMDAPSCPEEASPTASICSNEDIKVAEEADLISDPVELVEHEDVTPEAKTVPLTLSPTGSSRHADEEVGSASSESRSKDSNLTKPGSAGGCESKIFKKMNSAWNTFFRSKPSEKVQLTTGQDLDDAVELESKNIKAKSVSPCPEEASTTGSRRSSEDNKAAEESGLTSVPLELVDVADKDVTPESAMDELMKDNLVTDMDGTPGPFLVLPGAEHADELVGSASSESSSKDTNLTQPGTPFSEKGPFMEMDAPSKEDDKKVCEIVTQKSCNSVSSDEKSAGGHESKIFKKMNYAWNTFFRSKPSEKVQLTTGQDLDDAVELESCDSKSGFPCPDEMSPTASIHSCEDNKVAEESGLTSVPLELVDVADKDVIPQEKEDVASKLSTLSSLPPDSTPGPSQQDRHPEGCELIGLKNVFYTIIKGFFDSLTEEERREISKGVYNTDVKDKLAHNCAEVLRLVIETITDILSQAMNQFAQPHATLTRRSPTSSQACGAVGQNFVFTDNLQQSLKTTFGEAYCEVIGTDTSISITPKFMEAIMRAITDEVNSVLSETIQASLSGESSHVRSDTCCKFSSYRASKKMLVIRAIKSLLTHFETQKHSDCESKDDRLTVEHTVKVHEKKSPWWSCFRKLLKKKVHPVSDEQMDEAVRLSPNKLSSGHRLSSSPQATSSICSKCSSKLNSTPLEVVEYVEKDATSGDTGNTPPSDYIGCYPTACLEDTVMTQKHSDCESKDDRLTDEHTVKVHEKKSPWWSCFRKLLKTKVHPVSDEQMDEVVRLSPNKLSSGHRLSSSPRATSSICSKRSSEQNSTPVEVVDYVTEDEDFTAEDTGNTAPSHSIGWFPTACLEDEVIVSENQESPPLTTTQTEVRSSSRRQFGDSGDGKSDVGTEQGVTAASHTEANETQAKKSTRICPYCQRKMDDDPTASAQDQAVHTKRSSLPKRIWLFCCRQNCDSMRDLPT